MSRRRTRDAAAGAAAVCTAAAVATLWGAALSSAAGTPTVEEFGPFSPAASPCEIEFDRKGTGWVELVAANALGRLNPETGAIKQFKLPSNSAGIPGGLELGPDGGIWVPEVAGASIDRFDPETGTFKRFPIPYQTVPGTDAVGAALSDDVSFGKDGALYFAILGGNAIGRLDTKTGKFSKIETPTKPSVPGIIQRGPGNLMIFGMDATNKVGALDVKTQKIREYTVPRFTTQGVTEGPDGKIWYTSPLGQAIGSIDPRTGKVEEVDLLKARDANTPVTPGSPLPTPTTIRTGSDGNLYFDEGGLLFPTFGDKIGRYDPIKRKLTEIPTLSPASTPCDLNAQKPGEIWTGLFTGNKVARIKIPIRPDLNYCRQEACPDSVPKRPPSDASAPPTPQQASCLAPGSRLRVRLTKGQRKARQARVTVNGRLAKRFKRRSRVARITVPKRSGRKITVRVQTRKAGGDRWRTRSTRRVRVC